MLASFNQSEQSERKILDVLLCVMDSATRNMLHFTLARRGHHVATCTENQEIIERLGQAHYDLIFVELPLFAEQSKSLMHRTKANLSESEPFIVALPPGRETECNTTGIDEAFDYILQTPLTPATLDQHLDTLERKTLNGPSDKPTALIHEIGRHDTERMPQKIEVEPGEHKYSALLQNLPIVAIELDDRFAATGWSTGAVKATGWQSADVIGRSLDALKLFIPSDLEFIQQTIVTAATRPVNTLEFRATIETAQRQQRVLDWTCLLVRNSRKRIMSIMLVGSDHTAMGNESVTSDQHNDERLEALIQHATDGIVILDTNGIVTYASPTIEHVHGYRADWWLGRKAAEFIRPADLQKVLERINRLQPGESSLPFRCQIRHRDGVWQLVEATATNLLELDSVAGIVINTRDLSRRIDVDMALRQSEERFRSLVQNSSDVILVFNAERELTYTSPAAERVLGTDDEDQFDEPTLDRIHPEDREQVQQIFEEVQSESGAIHHADMRFLHADGTWHYFEIIVSNLLQDPGVEGIVINARDVTERRIIEEALRSNERRFRSIVQNSTDIIAIVSPSRVVTYQSPSVERTLGHGPGWMLGQQISAFIHPDDHGRISEKFNALNETPGGITRCEIRLRHTDGGWRLFDAHCTNLTAVSGINGFVLNARDITDRKLLERRLSKRAFYDSLTGLPNRALFLHRLARALNQLAERELPLAVLFLDLDRFKVINDSLGHEVGDQLLVAIARRLQEIVRPGDTVARFGGDEMIILLDPIEHADEADQIAQRIIHEIAKPIRLVEHDVNIATSIGIAVGESGTVEANDLIRNADIALYRAKESGSGRAILFDASMAERLQRRLFVENDLRQAIEHDQFQLNYMPELDLSNGRLSGLEVLVRWQHPDRGEIMPAEFMQIAEETGLIIPLGRFLINRACAQIRRWHRDYPSARGVPLAINLSAPEFQQADVVDFILSTLESHALHPQQLRLEVCEDVIISDPEASLEKLLRLREHGFQLAIDDFGSGFSSLSYLTQETFDILKIAREFISGTGGVTRNLSIVRAVTSLAHALGMLVTAEGIETREHLARVRAAGCDYGQGHLFSHPLQAHEIETLLLAHQERHSNSPT